MKNRTDIYTRVTNRIIEALERGVRPWTRPWAGNTAGQVSRPLRHNGVPYRGVNVLLLWAEAAEKGFTSPYWLTFRQAAELKGHVRKGESGTVVVYSKQTTTTVLDAAGEEVEESRSLLRSYVVFNVDQIDGLPVKYYHEASACKNPVGRNQAAEEFFTHTGAVIIQGRDTACYIPSLDRIHIPRIESFKDAESFYATLAHETTHWTMHKARLDRTFGSKRWGDEGYAIEELVADLGAAFLCADLGLGCDPREEHAAYLAHWLKVLKADRQAIFCAASHAQRACDFLHSLQPKVFEIDVSSEGRPLDDIDVRQEEMDGEGATEPRVEGAAFAEGEYVESILIPRTHAAEIHRDLGRLSGVGIESP